MSHLDPDTELVHGLGECPACRHTVHVIGDRLHHRARWVCTQCNTVGTMPLFDAGELAPAEGAFAPATA